MVSVAPNRRTIRSVSSAAAKRGNQQYKEALAFRQMALRKLVGGLFFSDRERQHTLEQAGLSFPGSMFRVLVFSLDEPMKVVRTRPPRDIALFGYGLANIAQELLGDICFCEKAAEEGGELVLLLNSETRPDRSFVSQWLSKTLTYVSESLSVSYSVGVSNEIASLDELPRGREQALTAAKYNAVFSPRSVIFYSDVAAQERQQPGYPFLEEQLLLGAIAQRSQRGVLSAVSSFRSKLFQCQISDIRPYLLRLATSLKVQMFNDCGGSVPPYFSEDLLRQTYQAETYMELLTNFALAHLDFLERKRLQQKEDVLSNVSVLIRRHFQNPDLSIETLLEQSGYSPGYARKLFQDVYHCTPHDYLLTLRMDEAQRLLRETDEPVKAVAAAVGFHNPSYFYAVFKKQVGISVQDFRAQYQDTSLAG